MFVVVVAEDEPVILMNIVDHLIEEGFEVLEARHAAEALDILRINASDVHVLFTDVQMPGEMDGIALSHHVKAHWPWIGLLVTSAHVNPLTNKLPEGSRFLPKPYHHAHAVEHLRALTAAAQCKIAAADRGHFTAANHPLRPPDGGPATYLANGAAAARELQRIAGRLPAETCIAWSADVRRH